MIFVIWVPVQSLLGPVWGVSGTLSQLAMLLDGHGRA